MPDIDDANLYEEILFRVIESSYDMHHFNSLLDGLAPDVDGELNSKIMEQHCSIIEQVVKEYADGKLCHADIQLRIDELLAGNELYNSFKGVIL